MNIFGRRVTKFWFTTIAAILAVGFGLFLLPGVAAAGAPTEDQALIVMDRWPGSPDLSRAVAVELAQMLGHFPVPARLVYVDEYQPGLLTDYAYGFFVGMRFDLHVPEPFLKDVRGFERPFLWVNRGLDQLGAGFLRQRGFTVAGTDRTTGFHQVRYLDTLLRKADSELNLVQVTNPSRCEVVAQAEAGSVRRPYLLHSGQFWYVADSPLSWVVNGDRSLAFADALHDFFGLRHSPRRQALIRIEDVNPTTDPASLRDLADRLHRRGVPFLVAVIPEYVSPERKMRVRLSDRPQVVRALKYMTARGGTVILHGYTHNYIGTTADDFEFWNRRTGGPPREDSPAWARRRVQAGVRSLLTSGVYPLAWETPHYVASNVDYAVFGEVFGAAVEQRALADQPGITQSFPFVLARDIFGQTIYPENLGYIRLQRKPNGTEDLTAERRQVADMLRYAAAARVLRDATVGAFVHPFISPELAEELVSGLKRQGYAFLDLKTGTNQVRLPNLLMGTGTVHGTLRLRQEYLHESYVAPSGAVARESFSSRRLTGDVDRKTRLRPGWLYVAEGRTSVTFWDRLRARLRKQVTVRQAPGRTGPVPRG